jgi:hypothetical protein
MTERYDPYGEPARAGADRPADQGAVRHDPDDWRERTTPGLTAVPPQQAGAPTSAYPAVGGAYPGQGFPGPAYGGRPYAGPAYPGDPYAGGPGAATTPDYTGRPIAYRRPDGLAGLLLLLAGVAAGVSLLLRWVTARQVTGWDLAHSAWQQLRTTPAELARSGLWQPAAVLAAGAILFVLGLLLLVPARAHRFLGVLALLVSLGAGAGVLVALSGVHWQVGRFQPGFWCAVAVPVLGLLGALKAMMTAPRSRY